MKDQKMMGYQGDAPVTAPKSGTQKELPPIGGKRCGDPNPSQCK